jgi:hypothetical protein
MGDQGPIPLDQMPDDYEVNDGSNDGLRALNFE